MTDCANIGLLTMTRILGLALLCFTTSVYAFTFVKEMSEHELQRQVELMMPFEQKTLFATISISNPVVRLFEDENKVGVSAQIETLAPNGLKGSGSVGLAGRVVYEKSEGAFYIKEAQIQTLIIKGLTEQGSALIKPYVQALISNALQANPVFVLDDENAQQKLAKSSLQSVEVNDGKLRIKIKAFQ